MVIFFCSPVSPLYYPKPNENSAGSDAEVLTQSERAAWAAVDRALAAGEDDAAAAATAAAADKKIFSELEDVDEAVSAACSSVIGFLLQV